MTRPWRLVFMGTPEFAAPALAALASSDDEVVMVVTQPDRPKGRGRKLAPPPVKVVAEELGLPVWQPESIKDPAVVERLQALSPDALVVVAFGQFLPPALLNLAPAGALNIHPSLLPRYRGPAPINRAVINGDERTGVTTMLLDSGMDSGPILLSKEVSVGPLETAGQLHDRLAVVGAELLLETISGLKTGLVSPKPQPDDGVSLAPMLKKEDGLLDWSRPAEELARQVRGLDPWPGAYTSFQGKNLKVFGAQALPGQGQPGRIMALADGLIHVAAGRDCLALAELQLAGKNRQDAAQFWNGQHLQPGMVFGD